MAILDKEFRTAITILAPIEAVRRAFSAMPIFKEAESSVEFSALPGDRGTVVRLKAIAPKAKRNAIKNALRRVRAVLESGEAPSVDGQPRGDRQARESSAQPFLH